MSPNSERKYMQCLTGNGKLAVKNNILHQTACAAVIPKGYNCKWNLCVLATPNQWRYSTRGLKVQGKPQSRSYCPKVLKEVWERMCNTKQVILFVPICGAKTLTSTNKPRPASGERQCRITSQYTSGVTAPFFYAELHPCGNVNFMSDYPWVNKSHRMMWTGEVTLWPTYVF